MEKSIKFSDYIKAKANYDIADMETIFNTAWEANNIDIVRRREKLKEYKTVGLTAFSVLALLLITSSLMTPASVAVGSGPKVLDAITGFVVTHNESIRAFTLDSYKDIIYSLFIKMYKACEVSTTCSIIGKISF
ncbi:hypothetical protein [Clostridium tertium]|uniref:hypothetical protein n=1 Tax=Clostridium tertium TaxID=1559 RepID=UPI0023B2CCD5|nr:hypothetical protein [Clostridium tertium]